MRPGFDEYEIGGALIGTEWSDDNSSKYKVMRLTESKDTLENETLHYPELMVREVLSEGYNEVRKFRVAEFFKLVESRGEDSLSPCNERSKKFLKWFVEWFH